MQNRKWNEFNRAVNEKVPTNAGEAKLQLRRFLKRLREVQNGPGGAQEKLRERLAIAALFADALSNKKLAKAFDDKCRQAKIEARPGANPCTKIVKLVWPGVKKSTTSRYADTIDIASKLSPFVIELRLLQKGAQYLLSQRNRPIPRRRRTP